VVKRKGRVAVALSGGVDSSCAATMLKEAGWDVIGVHLLLPLPPKERAEKVKLVMSVADKISVPIHILDTRYLFQRNVIDYFVDAYCRGHTPNPCVVCNHVIKFEQLIEFINQKKIDYVATGHYARLRKNEKSGDIELLKGKDRRKDQSYFLHRLKQPHLARTLFPLGEMAKSETYVKAHDYGLPQSRRHESQEVCFIPGNDYKEFVRRYVTGREMLCPGSIVDLDGTILGSHTGSYGYTIGQRHGLGIVSSQPLYVYQVRAETNEVVVAPRETLFSSMLTAQDFSWIGAVPHKKRLKIEARIRYRHAPARGTLIILSPDCVRFEFDEPQWAITPGQALVCYQEERVLGGGWIRKPQ
jgi:tRNA-specific 2-thiouridylase